jgi:hypothetical protein
MISRFPVHPGAAPELIGALGEDARSRVFRNRPPNPTLCWRSGISE